MDIYDVLFDEHLAMLDEIAEDDRHWSELEKEYAEKRKQLFGETESD